jgi:hypothetical protein
MKSVWFCGLAVAALWIGIARADDQLPEFTFQGHLDLNGQPASGSLPASFALFNSQTGGTQVGSNDNHTITLSNGSFSVLLSFPNAFTGDQLWLQPTINGQALARQPITAVPVAQYASNGARQFSMNDTEPDTSSTPQQLLLGSSGPFVLLGSCGIDSNGMVHTRFFVTSTATYSERVVIASQHADAGAVTVTPINGVGLMGSTEVVALQEQTGEFGRAWSAPAVFTTSVMVGTQRKTQIMSLNFYIGADGRPTSTGCVIEGTATLGL